MILNEEFFDEEEYNPDIEDIELDDYSKYGNIDGHQYKLTIKIVGNDSNSDSDAWVECVEVAYDLFEFGDFETQFDHSEFIYYNFKKEFVMGFTRNGCEGADFSITELFFEDLLDGFHKSYEGNYEEIVISIINLMYNYPVVTCYMKDKSDVRTIATKIAYKLEKIKSIIEFNEVSIMDFII